MSNFVPVIDVNQAKEQLFLAFERNKSAIFTFVVVAAMLYLAVDAEAAKTTDEFSSTSTKFEGWIKGNLGKAIALVALIIGAGVAAVKKDGMALVFALFIAIGIGIIVGVINATFTALI